ncbi:type I polyketide synthase [Amycolatopsis aidingensis]|uniref:type I polyketide synthase n=1 Tax=Amycolatopsis aidingensis TaxID=2842453 RepID=UPI001E44E41E|nr:type I polyketide synthase [Amycolatopsis aidingensis]
MNESVQPEPGAEPVAIIGMACRVPGAGDVARFWDNLVEGVESLTPLSRERMAAAGATEAELADPNLVASAFVLEDADLFDAGLFGMTPREAEVTDPQHRVFLELCHGALEDAGYDPARYPGDIGLYAGRGTERYRWEHVHRNRELLATTPSMAIGIGNLSDNVTTLVSYKLDLRGPSVGLFTACSTSLVAVHLATEAVRAGECDMALAGGMNIEFPQDRGQVHQEGGVTSADGHVRSFDAGATGTMWGSGGGAVLVKRLADARRDGDHVHAVLLGNSINNDGAGKVGFAAPSVDGQAAAIADALAVAGVDPRTIGYVEAHGTATPLGDPIELTALTSVYGHGTEERGWCGIGSVKSNIGHLSQGAGVVGLIKTALALEHGLIPPSLHYERPNPGIDFAASPFYVNATLSKWERNGHPRRAAVSSFGIGGTNAHVILEEAPERDPAAETAGPQLLRLSARDEAALSAAADRLAGHIEGHPELRLADVAHTLRVGRAEYGHRAFVVADTPAAAAAALRDPKRRDASAATAGTPVLAWLLTGQGAQFGGMGATLYQREPVFTEAVDECAAVLAGELGEDIRPVLFTPEAGQRPRLSGTELAQPALFTVEYALARLWQSWQVQPDTMIGHSVGEYVAATLAGVFELPDALRLVATRGRLMGAMPPGVMAAVSLAESEVAPLLPDGLAIATVNGPGTCVVSGEAELVEEFTAGLAEKFGKKAGVKRLRTSHAFHSPMMEPMLAEFADAVAAVPRHAPRLPFFSGVSGEPITADQAVDPGYWAAQVRRTVRFGDCVARLLADGPALFLECGPGRQLAGLVRMQTRGQGLPAVPSLPGPADKLGEIETLCTAAGKLWAAGIAVQPPARGRRVPLPGYPYQRSRYWVDPDPGGEPERARPAPSDARLPLERWFTVPSWRQLPPATTGPAPSSCVVFTADPLGSAVAERLRAAGTTVTEVSQGTEFARTGTGYTIRPEEAADYAALLAELEGPPERIVHAWALAGEPAGPDLGATMAAQTTGLFSLVLLVRALAEAGLTGALDVVTTGTQQVVGADLTRPEHATVAGVVRSAGFDVPGLVPRQLDCAADTGAGEVVTALGSTGEENLLALRNGRLWTVGFDQAVLPDPGPSAGPLPREGGVYLITGGLGGLGLTIAERLAAQGAVRLVLTSRSGLPARSRWEETLRAEGPRGRAGRAILAVRRMEAAGAEVLPAAVNVSDVDGLRGLRAEVLDTFGRLDGIVHAAGIAGGGLIETRQLADMRAVLAPKVAGTLALRTVFGAEELDFVALFSSVTGTAGGLGETDYCAANAFLDAYAQSTHGWPAPVRSLGWAGWLEVGMLADLLGAGTPAGAGGEPIEHPLLTEVGVAADGTASGRGTLSPGTHWALDEHRIDGMPVLPGTAQLEAIRATAEATLPRPGETRVLELSEVLFLEPFGVPEGSVAEFEVTLRPGTGGSAEAALRGGGTTYCRATVSWVAAPPGERVDLAAVRARCPARPDLVAGSGQPEGALVRYGARWDNIREVWRSETEQLTLLEVPAELREDAAWGLSPAVLDQATYVFDGSGGGALPMGYGRVLVRDRMPDRVWVYRRLEPREAGQDIRTDSFTVLAEDGTELVAVTEFMLRRMEGAPRPPGPGPVDAGQRWIEPTEGAEAFLRAMTAGIGGHVVITPRSLDWVLDQVCKDAEQATGGTGTGAVPGGDGQVSAGEDVVAGIWRSVLGVPRVSPEDDFFELGGNSLVAVQLIAQIREATGVRLPLRSVFDTPTVAEMAATVAELKARQEPEPEPEQPTIPRLARRTD